MSTLEVAGIDAGPVTAWFHERVEADAPLTFELIAGGRSNLTYDVTDASGRHWVLRRPPLGHVLATAHDMAREHRLIAAMADTDVPVPPLIGLCRDDAVNGAPFYVMDFIDGVIARDLESAQALTVDQRATASRDLVAVLGRLHAIDPADVGLDDLARKEDYIGRQLRRWMGQFEKSKTRDLPVIQEVHDRLAQAIPPQRGAGIVHGDYRLDNCIVGDDGRIAAVLDWELCTLGEVRADIALLMVYWTEADDTFNALRGAPTLLEGFASRDQLTDWYKADTDRDLDGLDYFIAFSYWRLACILEGVYSRYKANVMGDVPEGLDTFGQSVEDMAGAAFDHLSTHS